MKYLLRGLTACSIGILSWQMGFAQSNEISITFIGNAGIHMTDGKTHIYVDFPYTSGAYGYMEYDAAELSKIQDSAIFIFTHKHADHYAGKLVRKLNGKVYARGNRKKIQELKEQIPDFSITPLKTKHKFALHHYSYILEWHGKSFFISGDTEQPAIFNQLSGIDYAFITSWLDYYAREMGIGIDADHIVLYHLYPDEAIEAAVREEAGTIFDKQGMRIRIPY